MFFLYNQYLCYARKTQRKARNVPTNQSTVSGRIWTNESAPIRAAHSVCGLLICGSEKYPDHRTCLLQTDPLDGNFTETTVELQEAESSILIGPDTVL